ncbi:MAG TPA: hypothetical protein VF859_09755 [Burkholderiales bacterium]
MTKARRFQTRIALFSALIACGLLPGAAPAQPAAPVQSAIAETIACPAIPNVVLDYAVRGTLPQGWTPITKTPAGEPGGNTSVTLVPASVKVRPNDIMCGYATCVGSMKDCPPLLLLTMPKPSGKHCEEASGFRVRCSLAPKAVPLPK